MTSKQRVFESFLQAFSIPSLFVLFTLVLSNQKTPFSSCQESNFDDLMPNPSELFVALVWTLAISSFSQLSILALSYHCEHAVMKFYLSFLDLAFFMSTALLTSSFINRFLVARLSRDDCLRGRPTLDSGKPVIIVL